MVFGPGEYPRTYLDPNFFRKEISRLKLHPEIAEQFKLITSDLILKFQKEVNATSDGFINYLQQGDNQSDKEIMQNMKRAQGTIDSHVDSLLNDTKSRLTEHLGEEHAAAIDQFVKDLHKEVSSTTQLETRLRSDPALKEKLPPRSVFELPAVAKKGVMKAAAPPPAPTDDPLQPYIIAVQQWAERFPGMSKQYIFSQKVLLIMQGDPPPPPKTIGEAIDKIYNLLYTYSDKGGKDVYLTWNLSVSDLQDLSKALTDNTNKLSPPLTTMDQNYLNTQQWLKDSPNNPLAQKLFGWLQSLGSSDKNLSSLQQMAQDLINSHDPIYDTAKTSDQDAFRKITGASPAPPTPDPYKTYIDQVTAWANGTTSPQYQLGQQILTIINQIKGQNPKDPLAAIIAAIQQQLYPIKNGQDIYLQNPGLSLDLMQSLKNIFTSADKKTSLDIPQPTLMDNYCLQLYQVLNDKNTSPADKALLQPLFDAIRTKLGSSADQKALTSWAQTFFSNPDNINVYLAASTKAQDLFIDITKATRPTPPTPPTDLPGWEKEIFNYLQGRQTGIYDLLASMGYTPPPTTPAQWRRVLQLLQNSFNAAQQTGNWQQLAQLWGLPPGDDKQIQAEAQARLDTINGGHSAIVLFQSILDEIKRLEASKGTVADLKKWAQGINLANYPGLSDADKAEFALLLSKL